MLINYEDAVKAIEAGISEYTSQPEYDGYKLWENIVCGMIASLNILEAVNDKSSYSVVLSGLDRESLKNIRKCIDKKINDIEKQEKVALYRLSIDNLCSYYTNREAAKEEMLEEFQGFFDYTCDELNIDIDTIYVPVSELSSYHIIK